MSEIKLEGAELAAYIAKRFPNRMTTKATTNYKRDILCQAYRQH